MVIRKSFINLYKVSFIYRPMQLGDFKLRAYQQAILETAKNKNTLVVLPTGLGKTAIALFLAIDRLEKFPESKILFLAPTRPLALQHFETFKKHLPELYADLALFTGKINPKKRQELWQKTDIIFSTPQCIANDVKKGKINLETVSLLIEDEAHRCLKNYDYTFVAMNYKEIAKQQRILGLTASPGSNPAVINSICKNLEIEAVEIRHRYSEDVKPYIQELKTDIIKVELPEEFKKIREILEEIYQKKINELKNRKLIFTKIITKKTLLELQKRLQRQIATGNKHFNVLRGVSICAQAIKIKHAIEMLETQSIDALHKYMQNLFEQARQKKSKAAQNIIKDKKFNSAYLSTLNLVNRKIEHPKLEKLREILKTKEKNLKVLIFSQFRDNVNKINKEVNALGIKSKVFVGQLKKGEMGLSQKEQAEIIKEFSRGEISCLVSTSIGEEGLDIPEVNIVIFYEPIPSAIRKIQRAGRTARLMSGKLIILMTKGTVDEVYHWAAYHKERKMYGILNTMKEKLEKKSEKKKQLGLDKF